jgi:hypothetical protein
MDKETDSGIEKYHNVWKGMYNGIKDANQKLDHIIQNLREIYYTPIRCPFYDSHLHFKNNENNNNSDYF